LENSKLPLTEHLGELRKRILISFVSLLAVFVIVFNFSENIFEILQLPLKLELRLDLTKPYLHIKEKIPPPFLMSAIAEVFWMHIKISFIASFIISLPLLFYQFWCFISPGLLSKEKKYLLPFMLMATVLFLTGVFFCFFVVLPFAVTFFLNYKTSDFVVLLKIGDYIDFCLKFIMGFGVVFELPLAIILLARFGIVSPKTLAKHRKYAVLFAFVAAGILTPTPDAFNQILMAVPIIILYEIGIMMARIIYRKKVND